MKAFSLAGKVALVTGGGRGIGAGIARALSDAGAAVAVTARTGSEIEGVAKEIEAAGGRALAYQCDLRDLTNLPGLVERTVEELGGLDIVVNNAGGGDEWRAFVDTRVEHLETAFHFNVSVPFELVRLAVPHLVVRPGASVINITSSAIKLSVRGHIAYDAAKGALNYATRSMAADLGPKIRVNAIMPGPTETDAMRAVLEKSDPAVRKSLADRARMRRNGTPEDIGAAVVFLASPGAAWITGTFLEVDGGAVDEFGPRQPDL